MKTASSFLPAAPPAALACSIARSAALTWVSLRPASGPLSISRTPILIVSSAYETGGAVVVIAIARAAEYNALKPRPVSAFVMLPLLVFQYRSQRHDRLVLRCADGGRRSRPDDFSLGQNDESIRRPLDEVKMLLNHQHHGSCAPDW